MWLYLVFLLVIFFILGFNNNNIGKLIEGFDDEVIINPTYLQQTTGNDGAELQYTRHIIDRQQNQLKQLRKQVKFLAEKIDDGDDIIKERFYRRKLSNKYYNVHPYLSKAPNNALNLHDDDFSTKTNSTIKFLSQTRPSRFYGSEIHFPTELCGNFCTTTDENVAFHEQLDTVRPVSPTSYIRENAR